MTDIKQKGKASITGIVGGQWGDEGKAKIVDSQAADAEFLVRCQGGANAGHTVVRNGAKRVFHLIPSGILHDHLTNILGTGMVVDPIALVAEIDNLENDGIPVEGRLLISDRANIVLPYHTAIDKLKEKARSGDKIGTTGRGIGPAVTDKVARVGFRFESLLDIPLLLDEVVERLEIMRKAVRAEGLDAETFPEAAEVRSTLKQAFNRLAPLVCPLAPVLDAAEREGRAILLEGAQGVMLDPDHGTYPYVTSSPPTSAGLAIGAGVAPGKLNRIIGVFKAYATRVGNGPFPTELHDEYGENMKQRGREFGSTTGRPRRCGWFDMVAAKHAHQVCGFTEIALTKLDVLDGFEEIRVNVAYEIENEKTVYFPSSWKVQELLKPVLRTFAGWNGTAEARRYEDLPENAKLFVSYIESSMGCPVKLISTGPGSEQLIVR